MTPESSRAEDLFQRAVALPAGDRAAFLARECHGNPRPRAAIEPLLRLHPKAVIAGVDAAGFESRHAGRETSGRGQ